jgi:protein-tyrosine phosphatase
MSEITGQIWIGSYENVSDNTFLSERRITHLIGFSNIFNLHSSRFSYNIPLSDTIIHEKTKSILLTAASILDELVKEGKKIMVHCFHGNNLSVVIVMAYYIHCKGYSFDLAYSHITFRRYQTNINKNYIPILKEIELTKPPMKCEYLSYKSASASTGSA